MKKLMSLVVVIGITVSLALTGSAIKLTGKSVIYDSISKKYTIFLIDKNYREYVYQVKSKKNNKLFVMLKKSFVNKAINVNVNEKNQIITNLIP